MQVLAGGFLGVLFGVGLILSGMTKPAKVLAFLDVSGPWDPSLALVMVGAIGVYAPVYHYVTRRTTPWYATEFSVFSQTGLDVPLLLGAALFGVGWGLAGFCPGPGLVSAGSGASVGIVFVVSMLVGMLIFEVYRAQRGERARRARETQAVGG